MLLCSCKCKLKCERLLNFWLKNYFLQAKFKTSLSNSNLTFDENFANILVATKLSRNPDDSSYHLNITFTPVKQIKWLHVNLKGFRRNAGYKNEQFSEFLSINADACSLLKKKNSGDVFVTFLFNIAKQFGKLPSSCPLERMVIFY